MGNKESVLLKKELCKGILLKSEDDGFLYFAYTEKDKDNKDVMQYHMVGHFSEEDPVVVKSAHFGRTHVNAFNMDILCHTYLEKTYGTVPLSENWVSEVIQLLRTDGMLTDQATAPVNAGPGTEVPIYDMYLVDLVAKDVINLKSAKFL